MLLSVVLYVLLHCAHAQLTIRELGSMTMRQPGFSSIYEHSEYTDVTERFSLIISCFSAVPGTRDDVNFLRYIGKYLESPEQTPIETLGSEYIWPREPNQIPTSVFGFEEAVSVPSGFLVVGKNDGAVDLVDMRNQSNFVSTDISRGSNDEPENIWYYHRVIWKDADGDGEMDAFTCRCRQEPFPETYYSSFMWLKNPGGQNPIQTAPWDIGLRISDDDCDTFTREARLPAGSDGEYDAIFTIGYFMNKFSVYWSEHPDGLWNDATQISSRLIDTLVDDAECNEPGEYFCGHFFDVDIADMNNDGRLDLLVSINSEVWGSLAIYEIPDDFRTGEYIIHKIADGFIPTSGMQGGGSPGQPQAFYPTEDTSGKPWILLSGDDDGRTYYLNPLSEDPNDWSYNMTYFVDQGARNIVGKPTAFDSDGDGFKEVFVPCYSADEVKFFTFAP